MRLRQLLVACVCLLLPLTVVASSGATVHRGRASSAAYQQPAPSLFGINTGTYIPNYYDYKRDFAFDRALGGTWDHVTGHAIKWKNGHFDWSAMDNFIKLSKQHHLGMLVSLAGDPNPRSCSIRPAPPDLTRCHPMTASDFRMYEAFLRQELVRYRRSVTYFESWVEPNHTGAWPPFPNPAQYARVLKAQYSVFRAVNKQYGVHLKLIFGGPAAFSIAPGSPGGMAVLPFTHQVLQDLHGRRAFDLIGLHAYRFPPATSSPGAEVFDNVQGIPDPRGSEGPFPHQGCASTAARKGIYCQMTWREEISAYRQEFMNEGYGPQTMWLTEFGWPGVTQVPRVAVPAANYYPLYRVQKQDLLAAYRVVLHLRFVQAAFWFDIRDYTPGVPTPDPPFFAHFGLLTDKAKYKPAAYAFRALARANPGR